MKSNLKKMFASALALSVLSFSLSSNSVVSAGYQGNEKGNWQ